MMYNKQFLVVVMTLFSLMTASAASSYVVEGERDTARILKNSKNQKVSKNQKKGKSMKKSKKGGVVTTAPPPPPPIVTDAPLAPPTPAPTAPPTGTLSPTSMDSFSVRSLPFTISYSPSTNTPTPENYIELTRATQKYLEDFFEAKYEQTSIIILDNFLTVRISEAFIQGEPVLVTYKSNALFNPRSIFYPPTTEIESEIALALLSEDYLALIQSLQTSNPFSGTETTTLSTGAPTAPSTPAPMAPPTPAPMAPPTVSPAPTPTMSSFSVKPLPFTISYSPLTNTPTAENYEEVTGATQKYLEDFFTALYAQTSIITLDNFLTVRISEAFIQGEPALVTYESNALFNPVSLFYPPATEIESEIALALLSEDYLALIQSLSKSNPFSETATTTLSMVDDVMELDLRV